MIAAQLLNGLMEGMMLFLISSGLTLIFGISCIVNFAHGSLYMLGAFLAYQLMPMLGGSTVASFALSYQRAFALTSPHTAPQFV